MRIKGTMKKKDYKSKLNIVRTILLLLLVIEITLTALYVVNSNEPKERQWISRLTEWDEFGYGETNIGTSGLYVYSTRTLLDGAGYVMEYEDAKTNWELTTVVDSVQQTEYLIFKDLTTGNIAAVERRKYEETIPEEMKMYMSED